MQAALEAQFGVTRDEVRRARSLLGACACASYCAHPLMWRHARAQVLHVPSFFDHDRPFIPPTKPADPVVEAAVNVVSDAAYVDNATGGLVSPSAAFYSLVEHWGRWADCLGRHGLLVLEVCMRMCIPFPPSLA